MFSSFKSYGILVAQELVRAKSFYQDKLGLKIAKEMPGIFMVEAGGGSQFVVYEKAGSSAPTTTVLGFDVENLETLLGELKAKGVEQDMNDLPEGTNEQGIMDYGVVHTAWIKDSEGNVIALNEWKGQG